MIQQNLPGVLVETATSAKAPSVTLYRYAWNRMGRKDEICEVLKRGKFNSCLVRFVRDGHMAVTSRNAIRKVKSDVPSRNL